MAITAEQIQERANYLGGSDVAKILGRSKWGTPLSTYMSKVHPRHDESENRIGGKNEASYWGNELEDKVAEAFTKVTGKKVRRVNETLVHPEYEFMCANIDRRVVGEEAILECKTCSAYKADEWIDDEIPEEYILQVMHYLAVTGYEKGYVAVLIGGQKFLWKEVLRDEDLISLIIETEKDFWNNYVVPRIPPMPTGADKDSDIISDMFPNANPDTGIELPLEWASRIEERGQLIAHIKELEQKKDEIENLLKLEMKDTETATVAGYKITWKNQTLERVDGKLLKEQHPDVFESCKKVTESRVMRFAKPKKGKGE